MILIINGSFGVGKTTVAKWIAAAITGAVVYDPERWGYVLQRLPFWVLGRSARVDDFQDLLQWRELIARGIRRANRRAKLVIVPMAFSDAGLLNDLRRALETEAEVHTVCLVAPADVIDERLLRRAQCAGKQVSEFERRRSRECVAAHVDPVFGILIDATKAADQIAAEIVDSLGLT